MSAIANNWSQLLAEWWGGGCENYGWAVVPTNAANIIIGSNPPYQISDFLNFYPKFGTGIQGIAGLAIAAGIASVAPGGNPTSGYIVGDQLTVAQQGAQGGMVGVAQVDSNGAILALTLAQGGAGYSVASDVPTTGGSGQGATVNILSIALLGGSGYAVNDVVGILQQDASGGTLQVAGVNGSGAVTALAVQQQGTGYSAVAGLLTVGGSGTGLQVQVTSITPYNGIIPQFVLQSYINLALACLAQPRWLAQWQFAMGLFVAHYLTLYLRSEGNYGSTAASLAASGLERGVVVSKSAGDVSWSMQQVIDAEDWGTWGETSYGAQLVSMAKVVGSGMMYIY